MNKPKDFWCIVALSENGTGYIIQRSEDANLYDLMEEESAEDNGFNHDWNKGLNPGLYRCNLSPWTRHQDSAGEWDNGIDVTSITHLYVLPQDDAS